MKNVLQKLKPYLKKPWVWIPTSLFIIIILIMGGYFRLFKHYYFWWEGTGFHGKTIWDWLDLAIIPIFIAVAAWYINHGEKETEHQHSLDQQHDAALHMYLDRMSDLIIKEKLRSANINSEVRTIARTRPLATLRLLDPERKAIVLMFLTEGGLLDLTNPIVNLVGADLRKIDFSGGDLGSYDFIGTDFSNANLAGAALAGSQFQKANLSNADLTNANLSGVNFMGANLSGTILTGSTLIGANFQDAILDSANLSGAYFAKDQLKYAASTIGLTLTSGALVDNPNKDNS